jgi:upstream activation factor subunit UAF30
MVSNEELSKEIRDILKDADLEKLSRKMVRKQLEGKFHIDLGERKKFINETISQVFQEQQEEEEEEEEVVENEEEEDDEEDEVEEEEVKPQSSKRKASSSSKKKSSTSSSKRKRSESSKSSVSNNGFNAALLLSPELAQVLGKKELPRPQIVKAMWEYIHEHNLQDPKDKRSIILDERLRQVFQRDTFTMFSMNKYIKRHVCKPNELPSGGWDMIPRNGESSE